MLALHYADLAWLLSVYILDPPLWDPQAEEPVAIGPAVQKLHL
jgi:hypothetical protein